MLSEIKSLNQKGFCCSQIIMLLLLEARGEQNPGLIRALGGLCHGCEAGGVCGILTGGVGVLSYLTGYGGPDQPQNPASIPLINDFSTWFAALAADRFGGCDCVSILGENGSSRREICAELLTESWEKLLSLIESYGLDPFKVI